MFQNRVLRRLFGHKETRGWRKLHNERFILFTFQKIFRAIDARIIRWLGHIVHMGELRNAYTVLFGKRLHFIPLGRPWCR
jgi:hypothetical protein